jgi:hypothetical protein
MPSIFNSLKSAVDEAREDRANSRAGGITGSKTIADVGQGTTVREVTWRKTCESDDVPRSIEAVVRYPYSPEAMALATKVLSETSEEIRRLKRGAPGGMFYSVNEEGSLLSRGEIGLSIPITDYPFLEGGFDHSEDYTLMTEVARTLLRKAREIGLIRN